MDNFYHTWAVKFLQSDQYPYGVEEFNVTLHYPVNFSSDFKLTWGLQCYFPNNKNYLFTNLILLKSDKIEEVWANFKISIVDNKGNTYKSVRNKQPCKFISNYSINNYLWGFKNFIHKDILLDESKGLLTNKQFTIVCEITASSLECNLTPGSSKKFKVQVPECSLFDDFWSMYENKKLCDVIINVKDKEFKAHKAVLAARSPVFSAMFEHEMEESKLNKVNITDVDPEVFEEMIRYIYTGRLEDLESMAGDLLAASDKYQIERLKLICIRTLSENLSIDNAVETLHLADIYSISELKTQVLDFICTYAKDIEKTEKFQLLMTKNPDLFMETFRALANKTLDETQDPHRPIKTSF